MGPLNAGCDCHIDGTDDSTAKGGLLECHMEHGNCDCRHYVVGRQCDRCREGYWNLQSRSGCEPCGCDTIGSKSTNCDVLTGKCPCRPGVTGDKCEVCQVNHYGFSAEGCKREWMLDLVELFRKSLCTLYWLYPLCIQLTSEHAQLIIPNRTSCIRVVQS